jgi:hypothetical protein
MAIESMTGPVQEMEFLARLRQKWGTEDERTVLLGAPVYVAVADSPA